MTKDFLTIFKDFENTIRTETQYQSVKEYEDNLKDIDIQDKIRLLRVIRNYYSHHSDGEKLVKINKDGIDVLEKETKKILDKKLKVKDKYKSISKSKYLLKEDTVENIILQLSDKVIPEAFLLNENNYLLGKIRLVDIINPYINAGTKSKQKKLNITEYLKPIDCEIINKNDNYDELVDKYYLVGEKKPEGIVIYGEIIK